MNTSIKTPRHAAAFLKMLDPNAQTFHFRTFDDRKEFPPNPRNFYGSFEKCSQQLTTLNQSSAGIFVVVNDGGKSDIEIRRIRAVFVDTDGASLQPIIEALEPHIIIETSPGKWHVYWLVDGDFPLASFRPIQKALADRFSTDKSVNNESRVMRLPGFDHCKYVRHPCTIKKYNIKIPRYSTEQIIKDLCPNMNVVTSQSKRVDYKASAIAEIDKLASLEHMLSYIDRLNYSWWIKVGFLLAEELKEDGRDLYIRWSRGEFERKSST